MRLSLRQSSYCHAESIVRLINCMTMDTQVCRVNIEFTINAFQSTSGIGNRPEIRCHSAVNARLTRFAFCLPTKTFHQSITVSPGNPRPSFCFVLNVDASERDHRGTKSVGFLSREIIQVRLFPVFHGRGRGLKSNDTKGGNATYVRT